MRGPRTLRGQLLLRVRAVLALLLVVLGISQYVLVSRYLQNQAADGLRQRIRTAFAAQTAALADSLPLDTGSLVRTLGGHGISVRVVDSQGTELAAGRPTGDELTGTLPAGDESDTIDLHIDHGEDHSPDSPSGTDDPGKHRPAPAQKDTHVQVIGGQRL